MKKLILSVLLFSGILFAHQAKAQWVQNGLSSSSVGALASDGTNLYASSSSYSTKGVFVSSDNGKKWTASNKGLTNLNVSSFAIMGSDIYVATGGVLGGEGVFVSSDNGSNWTAVNNGLTDSNVTCLAVKGTDIFAGTDDEGVFMSSDKGANWTAKTNGLSQLDIQAIAVSGTNIIVSTVSSSGEGMVYTSSDNGSNWKEANTGLPTGTKSVLSLAVNGSNIFAGTNGGGLFLSSDNGANWTDVNSGLVGGYYYALHVNGNTLYAGSYGEGVFMSKNNGANWTAITTGLTSKYSKAITVHGSDIYLGASLRGGIWKRPLSDFTVGVQKEINNSLIKIFPNPSTGKFTCSGCNKNSSVEVLNLLGEIVYKRDNLNGQASDIDLTHLSKGMYFIRVQADGQMFSKKILLN